VSGAGAGAGAEGGAGEEEGVAVVGGGAGVVRRRLWRTATLGMGFFPLGWVPLHAARLAAAWNRVLVLSRGPEAYSPVRAPLEWPVPLEGRAEVPKTLAVQTGPLEGGFVPWNPPDDPTLPAAALSMRRDAMVRWAMHAAEGGAALQEMVASDPDGAARWGSEPGLVALAAAGAATESAAGAVGRPDAAQAQAQAQARGGGGGKGLAHEPQRGRRVGAEWRLWVNTHPDTVWATGGRAWDAFASDAESSQDEDDDEDDAQDAQPSWVDAAATAAAHGVAPSHVAAKAFPPPTDPLHSQLLLSLLANLESLSDLVSQ
jgi:hypothetical protein